MEKKKVTKFPKGFFEQPRPTIKMAEALKDSKPFEWNETVLKEKTKNKLSSDKKVM